MTYEAESQALDVEILAIADAWHRTGAPLDDRAFNDLALRLFTYQREHNKPYARYCASLGFTGSTQPASWERIPPVPAGAFKETALTTFDSIRAALTFETSGTTSGAVSSPGRHYMETRALYDAALLATFDRMMLPDGARLRYLNLVPNPSQRPQSSLGYMMHQISLKRGDGRTGWYLRGDDLLFEPLCTALRAAVAQRQPVCLAATAFALVHLVDALRERHLRISLPPGSRVMETGGFKGRSRVAAREDLYESIRECFAIDPAAIVAEYGMTELTSQYYDAAPRTSLAARRKVGPPWLRTRVVGPDGTTLPNGTVGALVHVDLANRSSCIAIETEDLGVRFDDGLVLIGREHNAALRGCSLDAENLAVR
jgi:hypothetical protein